MRIVNLTPHDVNIVDSEGHELLRVHSTGLARCKTSTVVVGTISVEADEDIVEVPETKTEFGEVFGLPEPQDGTLFVVSRLVVDATHRGDLRVPNQTVRDSDGVIVGCLSLGVI